MRFNDYKIPPLKSWEKFQEMVCELFREVWKDPHAHEFDREGQRQNGIDILGKKHGAYLLSKWLNTFESADEILNSKKLHFAFRLTSNEKEEFREMMSELRED